MKLKRDDAGGPIGEIDVTKVALERALLFAGRLVRAAEGLGRTLVGPPPPKEAPAQRSRWDPAPAPVEPKPAFVLLCVDGEFFPFKIEERRRRQGREPT